MNAKPTEDRENLKQLHWQIHTRPAPDEPGAIFYTVTCDELPGLIHTDTELQRCMSGAIEAATHFIKLIGNEISPEPEKSRRSSQMNLKLSEAEYGMIRRAADASGATASAFVRKAALNAAKARDRNNGKALADVRDLVSSSKSARQRVKKR